MPYQANDQETCLFCLGETEPTQPLQKNKRCDCKYTYHDACYARYDRKDTCPLCKQRKNITINRPPPSAPSQHYTITVSFPDAERPQNYIPVPAEPQQQPQQQQTIPFSHRKLTLGHAICLLIIIAVVIAMIVGIIIFYS